MISIRRALCCSFVVAGALAGFGQPAQDVLYLQDGRERVGRLVQVTSDEVMFRVAGETEPTAFSKTFVQRVELSRQRAGDAARTVAALEDPVLQRALAEQPNPLQYPDSGHVTLYRLHDCTLAADGGYTIRERRIQQVLLERGKAQANIARPFKHPEETLSIDFARTINPDGSITPISDAAVDITDVHAATPQYDKLRQAKFAMKQVRQDSVLDYQLTRRRAETSLFEPFFIDVLFQTEEPIEYAELRVTAPPERPIRWQGARLGERVTYSSAENADGSITHRWIARAAPRVVPEPLMPVPEDLLPRVMVADEHSWAALGAALADAVAAAGEVSPDMETLIADLGVGEVAPAARAAEIFTLVNEKVRYLAVAPDDYSYLPYAAAETLARRAGNALDKAVLLAALLRAAGLDAGTVLVCPQEQGALVADVPAVPQFTDAVACVTLPERGRVFLPVMDDTVRFGQLPTRYQGALGLLVAGAVSELVELPILPPEAEQVVAEYDIRVLPRGDLRVLKTVTFSGNDEMARRRAWKNLKNEELRRRLEVRLTRLHAKARLDDFTIENLTDLSAPLRFTEAYTLVDYALRAGDDLLVFQLPELDYGAAVVGKPAREHPLRWPRRERSVHRVTARIPADFSVYYAGRDYSAGCDLARFEARFAADGRQVRYEDEFVQEAVAAPAADYASYKACLETRARVPREWIVLERARGR